MRHGSLFSGIGGFDLASKWMGWENIFHCEKESFCQKVLKYHFPNSILHDDIKTTDFTIYRGKIDILTGGFPCQPFSNAGKRKGTEDDRHLWPEMLRAIREIQPRWIVGENVYGLINWSGGLVFNEVQIDLENEGYEVTPYILPACAVNAPHRRDRIWFVAYSNSCGNDTTKRAKERIWQQSDNVKQWYRGTMQINGLSDEQIITDTHYNGCNECNSHNEKYTSERGVNALNDFGQVITANTNSRRQPSKEYRKEKPGWITEKGVSNYWQNFPTQAPICDGDDGLSSRLDAITFSKWRNESIKAGGNAIVPQIAFQIFKAINEYESI